MPTTDTKVKSLVINELTKAQYDNIPEKSDTELYVITDDTTYEETANKSDSYTQSSSKTYASTKALVDGLATKQDELVSGVNIKTINNESLLGSGDIVITSAPPLDEKTITKNDNDELQASGTLNHNVDTTDTEVVFDWVGTLAEYTAQQIEELHPEWLCYITDDFESDNYEAYTKTEVNQLLTTKQDKLIAGANITIVDNIISSTGGGSGEAVWGSIGGNIADQTDLQQALGRKVTATYDAVNERLVLV